MVRCTRKGCGKDYDSAENTQGSCTFHPGGPVFHEGLKSWSCCSNVNRPVLTFEEFLEIPGCASGCHTEEAPQVEAPKSRPAANFTVVEPSAGKEQYSLSLPINKPPPARAVPVPIAPTTVEEEEDLDASVQPGTPCTHRGCNVTFVSNEVNRIGDGEGTVCTYHPAPPLFREGSKGYLCCKRRVLEFDEFLKIEGCKKGRHLFAPRATAPPSEEIVNCRIDHYQTLTEVHVSVFAKNVDKDRANISFEESKVFLDLHLPDSKRFSRTLDLFGPIDPAASSFAVRGTKVELHLKKLDNRSWAILEKTNQDLGGISFTFGVAGRTGTIGGKEMIHDETNVANKG